MTRFTHLICIPSQFNNIDQYKNFLPHSLFILMIKLHQPHYLENIIIYATSLVSHKTHISHISRQSTQRIQFIISKREGIIIINGISKSSTYDLIDPSTYSPHIKLMNAWMSRIDSIMHNTDILYIFSTLHYQTIHSYINNYQIIISTYSSSNNHLYIFIIK